MILSVVTRAQQALKHGALAVSVAGFATSGVHAAVVISVDPTTNMSCSNGVCKPTAATANLNVTDLANLLASGNVKVVSDSAAEDIRLAAPLSWTSASRLTLDSHRSIAIKQPLSVTGTGALTLRTNDGGSGGDLFFEGKAQIEFWDLTSGLVIDGNTYTLVRSIRQLADAVKADPAGSYALAKQYDAGKHGAYAQSPISTTFYGRFEGLGNAISGFSMDITRGTDSATNFEGLFAQSAGAIENLEMQNVNVTAAHSPYPETIGALVGRNIGSIRRVSITGVVTGRANDTYDDVVGGMTGLTSGTIANCRSTASVTAILWAGGLVGQQFFASSSISDSYATGPVSGGGNSGGLAAYSEGSIISSFATGAVDNSKVTPYTTGEVGGLVGENHGAISNSYARGSATGFNDSSAGGLVGYNDGQITTSYSIGVVGSPPCTCGGLIGDDEAQSGSLASTYWDLDTSGITDPARGAGNVSGDPGITGLSDGQIRSGLPSGFDPTLWAEKKRTNGGYPYLRANPPPQ